VTTRLADLTTLRLGGPAARFVVATDEGDVVDAVLEADGAGEPLLVLAGGSNVVVADEGFPGVVVHVATRGIDRREEEGKVVLTVQAGEPWDPFVAFCVEHDLSGVEALSGIPGSVGATPIQNVGAYGQEVAETIDSVLVLDRERKVVQLLDARAAEFSYRSSAFKRTPNRWVVLAVTFALDPDPLSRPVRYPELARELGVEVGDRAPLAAVREAVLTLRRRKGMVVDDADPDSVSAGSFFTNPVLTQEQFAELLARVHAKLGGGVTPPSWPEADGRVKTSAAWLIERAGFARGHGDPATIAISAKHTLALTNRGAGTTALLVALAREIADGVRRDFGVDLVPEPVFVGHAWAQAD
jgi:UDP-N-acetylmuramate dehydrogenase